MVQYGSVKVRRRIHVSNQRALASKSEGVEGKGREVRGSSCQISTRTRTRTRAHILSAQPSSIPYKAIDRLGRAGRRASSKAVVVTHARRSQLSSNREGLLLMFRVADRKEIRSRATTSARSFVRRASSIGGDALRSTYEVVGTTRQEQRTRMVNGGPRVGESEVVGRGGRG
jgi:hypothetical protein